MKDTKFQRNPIFQLCKVTGILAVIFLLASGVSQPAFSQPQIDLSEGVVGNLRERISDEKEKTREHPKIEYSLVKVRDKLRERGITKENARERGVKQISTPLIRIDDKARIQVYVYVTSTDKSGQARLSREGLKIEIVNDRLGIIQGWLPEDALETVARLPFVKRITPPSYGTPNTGSVTTEGDGILLANELRALGFDGTGVRVGVISDGVDNIADAVATGDLPPGITVFGAGTSLSPGPARTLITRRGSPPLGTLAQGQGLRLLLKKIPEP